MTTTPAAPTAAGPGAWTLWSALRRPASPEPATAGTPPLREVVGDLTVTLRGLYDVSGLRADADVLVWLHGDSPAALQAELRRLRRTAELTGATTTWAGMGVHRPAEFSAAHVPAYMRDTEPLGWLTLYPFVRSYEWYLLPSEERRTMLAEHGRKGREHATVQANTVASFALGDYEWLLAFESDDPTELVDLMRSLRETEARRHVREEVPFFTGRRVDADDVAEVLR